MNPLKGDWKIGFMKLSVLMPVYNERKTLAEIVSRVLKQRINGIDSLELVIVDDASTDGSTEIIEQLAGTHQQIKPIFFKKRTGGKVLQSVKRLKLLLGI